MITCRDSRRTSASPVESKKRSRLWRSERYATSGEEGTVVSGDVWKRDDVATRFLTERSAVIPDRARQLEVTLRLLRSAAPLRRILDLGAGDAVLLATALEAFPEASGLALDFSPPMLDQAR